MQSQFGKPISGLAVCSVVLALSGCVETSAQVAVSEADPELILVRGYRSAADECQLVGETAFTVDFLDDAADLVACPNGGAALTSLIAETAATILAQTKSYTFLSVPFR